MSIILHCFGESGNSYKAALTLELSGLEWIPEKVDFFNGAARTPEFKSLNILGEAPVMVDGTIILRQSGAIQQTYQTNQANSADLHRKNMKYLDGYYLIIISFLHKLAIHGL